MKITFVSNDIIEVKTKISSKKDIDSQIERFRIDMLAKHDLLFTKAPHYIKINY